MSDKATILIVDNDPDIINQLTIVLESEGHRVVAAGNREEAEEAILSVRPDLAILDVMMEEMDSGFVLAHNLLKLYPKTPIILLTAVAAATGMSFASQYGDAQSWVNAAAILDKPVRPEQIKAHVRKFLKGTRTDAQCSA